MNNLISKKSCPFHLHDQLFVILVFVLLLILNAANREFFVYLFCLFSQNESNVNKSQKADKLLVMFFFHSFSDSRFYCSPSAYFQILKSSLWFYCFNHLSETVYDAKMSKDFNSPILFLNLS